MQQCWRHASTAAVNIAAKPGGRHRKWLWAGAGVAGIGVLSSTVVPQQQQHGSGPADMENPQQPTSALGFLQQQLSRAASALWPAASSSKQQQQQQQQQPDSPSFASEALAKARATSARWLAQWAEDPEAREALLAFGSRRLLDFLIDTATEDPSPEQAHAEQALCNFLAGHHTCSRLLARPGAVPRLLQHVASGKASEELVAALHDVINTRGADFKQQGLREEDGRELVGMLGGRQGQQVQGLALQFLTAWAAAGQAQARLLSQQGLAPALGLLAMDAVAQGEAGRGLQAAVCRLQRVLLSQQGAVSDAELAGWMQPLLFMAADAAAAAAAAAAGAGKGIIALSTPLPTMTTLAAAVVAGGPEVRAASRGLHLLPTLDCLALSPDPAMKSRAAAALAALVTAGLVESEEARTRWRDMLLGWLISSTASTLKKPPSASSSSSSSAEEEEEEEDGSWFLSSWFKGSSSSSEKEGGDGADAANAALARSCVAALRALSQEPGPAGLSVTQLWLSAAEELKAASLAMLSSWQAAAQQLALPSDLMPGMFAPAVVEAYPAAARVVDYSVAQQRTTHVMELLAAVVAEDPTKQAWLLAAGILPIMERLVLHADAGLDPEGFVAKYSSSSSSSGNADGSSGGTAVQALLSGTSAAGSGVASEQQQQQQQQQQHIPAEPEFDVVFIHGIRGGPFVTWRKGGAHRHPAAARSADTSSSAAAESGGGSSSSKGRSSIPLTPSAAMSAHKNHMTRADCWPASWLAADMPRARLLSVEYKAPVTGWEGESLSLPDSGRLLLHKLVAAGVGERPVVFVAHSMGGLVVKEMLSLSLDEAPGSKRGRLAAATKAIAFYSTPHFGSSMAALGWKLRHLPGASPAPSIHHLSPGPHLAALNARLAVLHESGRVQVLSFTEGLPTSLAGLGFIPKILIVPFESAYPGFGAVHVLGAQDHIDVCKPDSRQAPAYAELLQFVRGSMAAAGVAAAAVAAGLEDADASSSSSSSSVEEGDSAAGAADAQEATAGADELGRAAE
ncbi:hypothetical protein OEZ85_007554 [Tetradesmus obliquus]|uniref:Protein SERAC1 n=1 Tax=Tetradesmus obliquus TaxID=3088 RepID=A0ABY8TIF7_TETOB|nr:hypothetical protein OEZ85_007554 [Tetradesmus obliquus]